MITLLAWPLAVLGADDAMTRGAAPADPVLTAAREAAGRQDFAKAAAIMRDAVSKAPTNADYHNLYAYMVRKGANPDMELVFRHYREALRLDPEHRGAHEYIGEAYLMVGDLARAREHLARLDRLCLFGCAAYTDLKEAIAVFEAKHGR